MTSLEAITSNCLCGLNMAHDVVFRVVLFQKHILEPLGYYLGNQRDTAIAVRFRLFTQSVAVTYSERQRERERESFHVGRNG